MGICTHEQDSQLYGQVKDAESLKSLRPFFHEIRSCRVEDKPRPPWLVDALLSAGLSAFCTAYGNKLTVVKVTVNDELYSKREFSQILGRIRRTCRLCRR